MDVNGLAVLIGNERSADLDGDQGAILPFEYPFINIRFIPRHHRMVRQLPHGDHIADRHTYDLIFIITKQTERLPVGSQIAQVQIDDKYTFPGLIEQSAAEASRIPFFLWIMQLRLDFRWKRFDGNGFFIHRLCLQDGCPVTQLVSNILWGCQRSLHRLQGL